jgi:AmmeMemoRadiSam system protein A
MSSTADTPVILSAAQGRTLLELARATLSEKLGRPIPPAEHEALRRRLEDPAFDALAGTFVSLKLRNCLRGCIGCLHPIEPIRTGVRGNALNSAFHDPRFSSLTLRELDQVQIEVSVLSAPCPLDYTGPEELIAKLAPNVHGVILRKGHASATFLPQVWEQLPATEEFLGHLCRKAGLPPDEWKRSPMEVSTYRVQSFTE